MDKFDLRLIKTRLAKGLNQYQLATLAGISPITLSALEKGPRKPRYEILIKLADALDVSCDYLTGRMELNRKKSSLFTNLSKKDRKMVVDIIERLSDETVDKLLAF